jgi:aminoglycoside phosphotransferase family enzyme
MNVSAPPELITALLNPKIYPHLADRVKLVETYISWVFLAGDYAYKVKKPVDYGYLDFTTLEKRLYFCQREVELNRRLCLDIYLGVIPIMRVGDKYFLDGIGEPFLKGEVVEYAVKMYRLPQNRMLDALLAKSEVTPEMMAAVAKRLAEFHKSAETSMEISSYGHPNDIKRNALENFEQTERFIGRTITKNQFQHIRIYTMSFIAKNRNLFYKRVNDGKIRDCHGDVHTQHICFFDGIQIFDCIEFSDRFRYGDVASEVAFLAMDLDGFGRRDLSKIFVDAYVGASGDTWLRELLDFYKCYRAYVRGKVRSFRLDDPHIPPDEEGEALEGARGYFELAESYIGKEE